MNVSQESKKFIEDLRLYLFSTGKSYKEIEDIVEELEDHLLEAEKNGKSVRNIVGNSPKEYMEQLAKEMSFDVKSWIKYGVMTILGVFAFVIMEDVITQETAYSWIELFGYPLLIACFLLLFMKSMGYLASHRLSKYSEWFVLLLLSIVQIGGFILLILLNNRFGIMVVQFGTFGNIVLFCLATFIFIGCSIWSKSLVLIIIPILLYVPKYVLTYTQLSEDLQMILSYFISILGISIYLFLSYGKDKDKDKTYSQ